VPQLASYRTRSWEVHEFSDWQVVETSAETRYARLARIDASLQTSLTYQTHGPNQEIRDRGWPRQRAVESPDI
jgi:hypothetical protein